MSYERMEKRAAELEAEVAKWLSAAEAVDAAEDKLHGSDARIRITPRPLAPRRIGGGTAGFVPASAGM
jgi:hypothetical protein